MKYTVILFIYNRVVHDLATEKQLVNKWITARYYKTLLQISSNNSENSIDAPPLYSLPDILGSLGKITEKVA